MRLRVMLSLQFTALVLLVPLTGAEPDAPDPLLAEPQRSFTPSWYVGDWWEVGYATAPRDRRMGSLFDQGLEAPFSRRRFEVIAETDFAGRHCYQVVYGVMGRGDTWRPSDTLYFEKELLLLLGSNHGTIWWSMPGPYVISAMGLGGMPAVPEFPLFTADTSYVPSRSAQFRRGLGGRGWFFKGVPGASYGSHDAAQVTREALTLPEPAALEPGLRPLGLPDPPYIEVMIAYGGDGRDLVRQIWHRDMPWFLFAEWGVFTTKPGWKPRPSEGTSPPQPPTHGDIDRENLSEVKLWARAWLLDYGKKQ